MKFDKQTKQWTAWGIVAVVLTLLAVFLGVKFPVPPAPTDAVTELGTTHFTNLEAEDITATDDLVVTDDSTLTDDVAVGGDLAVTGASTQTGDLTLAADLTVSPVTAISVTAAAIITPTGTYQPLTSAAAVTTSTTTPIAPGTTGQLLILENQNASDVITIDGTGGTVECISDQALGPGDTITLIWDGSDWECASIFAAALRSDDLTLNDDLTVTDDAAVGGDLTVAADLTVSPVTAISLTEGAIITATGIYQPLTSAAAVTTSTTVAIAAGTTGQLLILENQNASDIIIVDGTGGTVECKADVPLGAGDTLTLIFDGADWQCISTYDNS